MKRTPGRHYDAEGRDVTDERTTRYDPNPRTGKQERGEWYRLSPVEAEMIDRYRETKAWMGGSR